MYWLIVWVCVVQALVGPFLYFLPLPLCMQACQIVFYDVNNIFQETSLRVLCTHGNLVLILFFLFLFKASYLCLSFLFKAYLCFGNIFNVFCCTRKWKSYLLMASPHLTSINTYSISPTMNTPNYWPSDLRLRSFYGISNELMYTMALALSLIYLLEIDI